MMSTISSNISDNIPNLISDAYIHKVTNDFDEQARFLSGWNQDYTQVSAGGFNGFITEVHLDHLSLFWEYTSQNLYQHGYLDSETIAIGVPLNCLDNAMFCGAQCEQNALHIYSGKDGFEFLSPQNLLIGLIVIDRHKLMHTLSASDQYFLNLQLKQASISKIPCQAYISLVSFLKNTLQALHSQPALANNKHYTDELSATAMLLVTDSLLNKQQDLEQMSLNKSWKVFADTREIINTRLDDPISVAELCSMLNISRRSLQYHFEQAINSTPITYLRAERLNGVRRMLATANSVTDAATYWGFWHFGHFSHEYKKMFGELPSETFKRLHHY
jgi:AraC family transcriptional regulator, ethanolamine operon transcriptional activator